MHVSILEFESLRENRGKRKEGMPRWKNGRGGRKEMCQLTIKSRGGEFST